MSTKTIEFRAKVQKFRSEVEQIPGITKKAARQMTRAFIDEHKKTENEARKAARAQARAAERAANAWREDLGGALDEVSPMLGRLRELAERSSTQMQAGAGSAGALAAGLGAVVAVGAAVYLGSLAAQAYEARVQIMEASQATNIHAETLAALELATRGTRVEADQLFDALRDFGEVMYDVDQSGGRAEETFRDLGIQVRDEAGRFRDVNDVFVETIDKLQGVESGAERAAYAQQLMSDDGARLMAVLGDQSLSEWVELSREFGVDVGPQARAEMAAWRASTAQLGVAMDQLGQSLLNAIGFETMSEIVNGFSLGLVYLQRSIGTFASEAIGDLQRVTTSWWEMMRAPGDQGNRVRFLAALDDIKDWNAELEIAQAVADDAAIAFIKMGKAREAGFARGPTGGGRTLSASPVAAPTASSAASSSGSAPTLADLGIDKMVQAYEQLDKIVSDLRISTLEGEAAIVAAYDARIRKVLELARVSGEFAAAQEAVALYEMQRERDIAEVRAEAAAQEQVRRREAVEASFATAQAAVDLANGIADMVITISEQAADAQGKTTAEQKKAMKAAFAVQKATALAQAGINTALAVTQALGQLPPPASFVVAGLAGALGAVQVGLIAAKQPPSFHLGGTIGGSGDAPDEVPINARRGEGVVSTAGMAALGRENLDAINRGAAPMSAPVVVVEVGGEAIEAATARGLSRPSPGTRAALRRAGVSKRPGHA